MDILLTIWVVWLVAIWTIALLVTPNEPACTIRGIFLPESVMWIMDNEERAAISYHELGHWKHKHPLKNMIRASFFIPTTRKMKKAQELEADNYALGFTSEIILKHAKVKIKYLKEQGHGIAQQYRSN